MGDLVVGHPGNQELLGSKLIGEDTDAEPALNCVLRALLTTTILSECIAAEYVFKCFCEVALLISDLSLQFNLGQITHCLIGYSIMLAYVACLVQ